ncbi:MAG TPA: DNA methyltransferase [Polyangiaceae bacterium]|jgi:DNA modification methylase|nr:DNA methyltransferase [Polyangiaceae bacterium]
MKRALTHVGGETVKEGARQEADALAHALDVQPSEASDDAADPARANVHGFHVYPARMHPTTASRLIELTSVAGSKVLDPFCGSGTVLVQAMIARRDAIGVDLNPFAVLLASRKVAARDEKYVADLLAAAARVRQAADERRKAKAGAHKPYGREDVATFDPHVLLELDGLKHALEKENDGVVRDDLRLALSAILTKVSKKQSDTSARETPKRIAAGYPAKLFVRKTEELVQRSRELEALLPKPRPRVLVFTDDARAMAKVRDAEANAVVTSPPYVGTYDYLAHHALRMRWLGLHSGRFEKGEIGSRRDFGRGHPTAERDWEKQLQDALKSMHRALAPKGRVAFVIADSELGGRAVRADEVVASAARKTGFFPVARASQARQHFHDARAFARMPRFEHALLLERV